VREALAPANNFGVLRVRQDILSGGAVGATIVGVTPLDHTDTFHAAYAGGFDLALQTRDHTYTALAQVVGSLRLGGDEVQTVRHPDGTVSHNQSRGVGAQLQLAKEGGTHWVGRLYQEYESPELDLNDAGYLKRQNFFRTQGTLTYRELQPHGPFLQSKIDVIGEATENADLSTNVGRRIILNPESTTRGFWTIGAFLQGELRSFDIRETGDGARLERPPWFYANLYLNSDTRRSVFTSLSASGRLGDVHAGRP